MSTATDQKSVDGAVDELLLGDGFSIVDSTNASSTTTKADAVDSKSDSAATTAATTNSSSNASADKKPTEKKSSSSSTDQSKVKKSEESSPKKTEKKPEPASKSSSTKKETDDEVKEEKVNGHEKSDALLITTEEDLELDKKPEANDDDSKKDAKKKTNGDVWVSNITRHIKATDVKKHFSKHGKVLTAKIVTNGRSFFGYILMESPEIANKCVKSLHGTTLEGKKITVSRQRPDAQKRGLAERSRTVVRSVRKTTNSDKKSREKSSSKDNKDKDSKEKKERDKRDDMINTLKRSENKLLREVDTQRREIARLRHFMADHEKKLRLEMNRSRGLQRDVEAAENKLRDERRKFDRERELFEKNSRTDRVKLEADRTMMKKELEEVKKLREYLKRKIEEDQVRSVREERRPRATSPYAYSSKRFRDDPPEKSSSKYEERTRTPPSPPKLSSSSRKRSPPSFIEKESRRGYHDVSSSFEKEVGGRHGSHGGSLVLTSKPSAPAPPRNIWPSPFHQEVWRMAPGSAAAPFSSSQFPRSSDYSQGSSSKGPPSYSQHSSSQSSRDFSKRDHYSSSSVRKY